MTHMRTVLKNEVKPVFQSFIRLRESDSTGASWAFDEFTIEVFDQNIDRLPDEIIIEMYQMNWGMKHSDTSLE